MRRFIPSKIKEDNRIIPSIPFTIKDICILIFGLILMVLILTSSLNNNIKIAGVIIIGILFSLSVITFDMVKGYKFLYYFFSFLFRKRKFEKVDFEKVLKLEYSNTLHSDSSLSYAAVIEVRGIDFGILEERLQDEYISVFAEAIKEIKNGKIIKLEKPIDLTKYIDNNTDLIDLNFAKILELENEKEKAPFKIRNEILEIQKKHLCYANYTQHMYAEAFYIVITDGVEDSALKTAKDVIPLLNRIGLEPILLRNEELRIFNKLFFVNDLTEFDEAAELNRGLPKRTKNEEEPITDFEKRVVRVNKGSKKSRSAPSIIPPSNLPSATVTGQIEPSESTYGGDSAQSPVQTIKIAEENITSFKKIKENATKITLDNSEIRVMALGQYPYFVANAWANEIFAIDGAKVVFNFSENTIKKLNKKISISMAELKARLKEPKLREDEKLSYSMSFQSLSALLEQLDYGGEKLHNTECYLVYPKVKHKQILKAVKSKGIKINDLLCTQFDGWVSAFPFLSMPNDFSKERYSSIQSSSVAGMFPFVAKQLMDNEGYYIGSSTKYPLFFNQFLRTPQRVNGNMVVLGKTGGGKSFWLKKNMLRLAVAQNRIFILDPDNEYKHMCDVLKGNWVDMSGDDIGRINPFHVFAIMNENNTIKIGALTDHRQFLESFFQIVCPEMPSELHLYLSKIVGELYQEFKITDFDDILGLSPESFPIFDDLLNLLESKLGNVENELEKQVYRKLCLYIEKFCSTSNGVFARLWNGYTTLKIENDFNVLNFQSLFASSNKIVANGQMLLIVRFLNQECIKNRSDNTRLGTSKGIVICIDEAHRFINPKFPIALDFMSEMAKQIRKYFGLLIVATQNIADFVGVDESMRSRASAVINACQYSMIFGLFADDINKIKDLYANYNGGLTQVEVDFITRAKQGDALFIVDVNTRIPVHIDLYEGEHKYIEKLKEKGDVNG